MAADIWRRDGNPVVVSPKDEARSISTVSEWLEHAGPLRGEKQWADGRSAKEVAKAWCGMIEIRKVPSAVWGRRRHYASRLEGAPRSLRVETPR